MGEEGLGAEAGGCAKLEFTFRMITHSLLVLTQPCSHLNFVVVNHDCQLGKIERHLGDQCTHLWVCLREISKRPSDEGSELISDLNLNTLLKGVELPTWCSV